MQNKMDLHVQWLIGVQSVLCRICDVSKREILICFCGIRFSLMPSELLCGLFFFLVFLNSEHSFYFWSAFPTNFILETWPSLIICFLEKTFFFTNFVDFLKCSRIVLFVLLHIKTIINLSFSRYSNFFLNFFFYLNFVFNKKNCTN